MSFVLSHIATTDITSSASTVTFSLPSDFSIFQLLGEDITGSGTLTFYMRVSTDNASTFKSGSTDYNWAGRTRYAGNSGGGSSNIGALNGDSHIQFMQNHGSTQDGYAFNYYLYGANNSSLRFMVHGSYTGVDTNLVSDSRISGSYNATTAVTDIQLSMASGTIESGKIRLYGVA